MRDTFKETEKTSYRLGENTRKLFVNNCIANKGLESRIDKEVCKLNSKKTNNSIKTWTKDLDTSPKRIHGWQIST